MQWAEFAGIGYLICRLYLFVSDSLFTKSIHPIKIEMILSEHRRTCTYIVTVFTENLVRKFSSFTSIISLITECWQHPIESKSEPPWRNSEVFLMKRASCFRIPAYKLSKPPQFQNNTKKKLCENFQITFQNPIKLIYLYIRKHKKSVVILNI